jgi:hypothetical protein
MNGKILLLTLMLAGTSVNAMHTFQFERSDSDDSMTALMTEEEDDEGRYAERRALRYLSVNPSFRDLMFSKALQYVLTDPSFRDLSTREEITAKAKKIAVKWVLNRVFPVVSMPELVFSGYGTDIYRIFFSIAGEIVAAQHMCYIGGEYMYSW